MKILISSEQFPPYSIGGVATAVSNLVKFLVLRGNQVVVMTSGLKDEVEKEKNLTIYRLSKLRLPFYSNSPIVTRFGGRVRAIFEEEKPDVVHIELSLGLGLVSLREAQKRSIVSVFSLHALPDNANQLLADVWPFSRFFDWSFWRWIGFFAKRVDCVTAPSNYALSLLTNQFRVKKAQSISNGLDLTLFKRKHSQEQARKNLGLSGRKVILYVGRLQKEKNPELLIRSAPLVMKKHHQALFILVGSGPMLYSLQRLVQKMGLKGSVVLPGFVEEEKMRSYLEASDISVMPSAVELQGISVMEAMAYCLPIVAANARALPELVKHGENGVLFNPGEAQDLTRKINDLLSRSDLDKLGKSSCELIKSHDIRETARIYEDLYESLIKEKIRVAGV